MITHAMFKLLLPLACAWAQRQESAILRHGIALTPAQLIDAHKIGVKRPERIRIRVVEEIRLPLHRLLRDAAESIGLISPFTVGMTLYHGIFIHSDYWASAGLSSTNWPTLRSTSA
jgi:hypothetical protein